MTGQEAPPGRPDGGRHLWAYAVNVIVARLETGELKPRQRVPSVRTLAAQLGLGESSVRRAYGHLVAEGVIERADRRARVAGHVVCAGPRNPDGTTLAGMITETLRDRISSGGYMARMPSRRELRAEFGCGTSTVIRVMRELTRRRLIVRVAGGRYIVRADPGVFPLGAGDDVKLGWLKDRWADEWEDIKLTWSGRCRSGVGRTVTAETAEDLDAAFRGAAPEGGR